MNEFFSFRRFLRLFVKHTSEHYRTYLMSIGVLAGVLVLCGAFLLIIAPGALEPGFQTASYVILLFVSGGIFTSTVFAEYGEKNRAIPALTLPATAFEKFLVGWLYSYPIFLAVYTLVFYLALLGLGSLRHMPAGRHFIVFSVGQSQMPVFLVMFTIIQSLALFGAIFFRKLQFIKTGFAFFITLGMVVVCNSLFLKIITGVTVEKMAIPFGFLNFYIGDKYYSIGTGSQASELVLVLLMVVAASTWVAAYYRLKEKQV
jgi:hypothetical protein